MAVAVASTAIKAYASGSTIVIDKPTGLAAGELMIALVHKNDGAVNTCSLTGWTTIDSMDDTANTGDWAYSLYKIASSADAAASNFTFTLGETKVTGGVILRITGFNTIAPINQHGYGSDGSNNTSQIFSAGAITPTENGLIIMGVFLDQAATQSTYFITTNNPTWTELADQTDASTASMGVAWAYRPELTLTGNYGSTSSGSAKSVGTLIGIGNAGIIFTDTLVTSESIVTVRSRFISTSDTIALVEGITNAVEKVWSNAVKNLSTWLNQDKS